VNIDFFSLVASEKVIYLHLETLIIIKTHVLSFYILATLSNGQSERTHTPINRMHTEPQQQPNKLQLIFKMQVKMPQQQQLTQRPTSSYQTVRIKQQTRKA
jgi:hypothetical protein